MERFPQLHHDMPSSQYAGTPTREFVSKNLSNCFALFTHTSCGATFGDFEELRPRLKAGSNSAF